MAKIILHSFLRHGVGAVWQVYLCGPMTRCVRWGPRLSDKRRFGIKRPAKTCNCKLQPNHQSYAATWWIQEIWANAHETRHSISI